MRTGEAQHLTYTIDIGGRGRAIMPHSDACRHMKIADKYMDFRVIDGGDGQPFVQLYVTDPDVKRWSQLFSIPITNGSAGLFDTRGIFNTPNPCYYYPHGLREDEIRDTGKLDEAASYPPDYPLAKTLVEKQ